MRAWAQGLLAQLRVEKITVLPIDTTRLTELGGATLSKQIAQLVSDSVTVTKKSSKPQFAANAAQASQTAGFTVRLPTSRNDSPQITVQDGTAFQFVVNRTRSQAMLNEAGLKAQLPASLDSALIKVNIPTGVTAAYGDCPKLNEQSGEFDSKGSTGRRFINCIILAQIPSPTVEAPQNLDLKQLAEIGLQFAGMNAEQAHAYSQSVDWTTTLVVPVPRNAASYKQVNVDGVSGNLIQRPLNDAPQYAIVWVKNKIVYAIGGLGSDLSGAMAMGNSLK